MRMQAVQATPTFNEVSAGSLVSFGEFERTGTRGVPEDWHIVPFNAAFQIPSGQVDPRLPEYRKQILVAPDHLESRSGRILGIATAEQQNAKSGKYLFKAGDIVYSKIRPYLRKAWLATFDGLCSADMYPLRARAGFAPGFLARIVLSEHFSAYAESVSVRSGMPKINREELSAYSFGCPLKLDEQEAIAGILDDADAFIESLERLLAKKRHLKQAAMQQLLTGKKRLPGFEGEWERKTIGELFDISGGLSASRDDLSAKGVCYLHYGDIHGSEKNYIDVFTEQHGIPKLDVPLAKVSRGSLLRDGDIVFVDASEDIEGTSKHVVISNPNAIPFISGLHTIVAKPKTEHLKQLYSRYCFQTEKVKSQFRFYAVGTKVSGVSKSSIAKIEILVPGRDEQLAIGRLLSDIDAEIVAIEHKAAKARKLKVSMMQELLTGKTRLV